MVCQIQNWAQKNENNWNFELVMNDGKWCDVIGVKIRKFKKLKLKLTWVIASSEAAWPTTMVVENRGELNIGRDNGVKMVKLVVKLW